MYVIKYIIVNDCFVICVGSSLLSKTVDVTLGNSECEVVSCVDIKDAYHSIRLTEMSKEYCGILPYFGSPIYRYDVLPMGIACA